MQNFMLKNDLKHFNYDQFFFKNFLIIFQVDKFEKSKLKK